VYPFFPKEVAHMSYLEIRKIFDFLKNLNNLLWSMDKKETVIEILTVQNTQALIILKNMRKSMEKFELQKNRKKLEN
jgi:hypothetical protein